MFAPQEPEGLLFLHEELRLFQNKALPAEQPPALTWFAEARGPARGTSSVEEAPRPHQRAEGFLL